MEVTASKKTARELDTGPLAIFWLTIPQLGLMLCHLAISITDVWVAGQISSNVLAGLGLVSQIFTFLMLVTSIVGSGCMATVSQSLGASKALRARRFASLIVVIAIAAGSIVGACGLGVVATGLHLFFSPGEAGQVTAVFAVAYCLQLPLYYCMIMLNSVFRSYRLVWLPFATLALVCVVNFVGSVGLGLGKWGFPDLGYPAVAWTTFFSTVLGFACNVWLGLRRKILQIPCRLRWRWARGAAPRLWRIGAPAALGNLAGQAGSIVLLGMIGALPEHPVEAVAAMTVSMRALGILGFPVSAVGMSATILCGHLLGARQAGRACGLGARLACWTAGAMLPFAMTMILFREQVARIFVDDPTTVSFAAQYVFFAGLALPFNSASQILSAVLAGAGATRFTCQIGCVTTWLITLPVSWCLAHTLGLGAAGIYAGMTIGGLCAAAWLVTVFLRKKWLDGY